MTDHIDRLIKEAAELEKDFPTGARHNRCWYPLAGSATQPGREETKQEPSGKSFSRLDAEAREMYGRLLAATERLVIRSASPCAGEYEDIAALCALTLETLTTNPVMISYAAFVATENYLYAHAANVTILSQAIALDYGLSQKDTILLSFCAMVNDLGMAEFRELYSKRGYFNNSEFSRITRHVDAGMNKLQRIMGLNTHLEDRAGRIIRQVHERADGSGYPLGLLSTEIDLQAQIIGVADIYEAMTHPRPWREPWHPCAVIKRFMGEDKRFGGKVLKSLIRTLSVYPPSSLVMLSSREIARVIIPRKESLARPLVEVLLGSDYAPVRSRMLDLSDPPICHAITRPVFRDELEKKNPMFAARLESARWWEKPAAD